MQSTNFSIKAVQAQKPGLGGGKPGFYSHYAAMLHGGTIVDSTKLASSGRLKFTQRLIRPICSSYCKGERVDRPVEKVDFSPYNTALLNSKCLIAI